MTWLLLIYKVPNEPSARRVYVWRKLKGIGALLLQDSVWVLPTTPHTREKMMWLATEIKEIEGGSATLWEADTVFTGQDADLVTQFNTQTEIRYAELLARLEEADPDLATISKQFQQAKMQDYFQCPLGEQVRQALLDRRGGDT